jgi:hypothetical protein
MFGQTDSAALFFTIVTVQRRQWQASFQSQRIALCLLFIIRTVEIKMSHCAHNRMLDLTIMTYERLEYQGARCESFWANYDLINESRYE